MVFSPVEQHILTIQTDPTVIAWETWDAIAEAWAHTPFNTEAYEHLGGAWEAATRQLADTVPTSAAGIKRHLERLECFITAGPMTEDGMNLAARHLASLQAGVLGPRNVA